MERNYEQGQEYFWKDKSLGGFAKVIGEIVVDDPTREIVGYASYPQKEGDGFFVSLQDLYKYRDFILTFTIGMEKDEPTIFWIHLV